MNKSRLLQGEELRKMQVEGAYNEWKHIIGSYDIDGQTITEKRLLTWANDPKRELMCIFCGSEPADRGGFIYCQRCMEYKGIIPNCPIVEESTVNLQSLQ